MEVIQDKKTKEHFTEKVWKYVQGDSIKDELSKSYSHLLVYMHEVIGSEFFYNALKSSFENSASGSVYVGSGFYEDSLFLIDLANDSANVLDEIVHGSKSETRVGFYITTNKIFFLSKNEDWLVVGDRYNDVMLIAYNSSVEHEFDSLREKLNGLSTN